MLSTRKAASLLLATSFAAVLGACGTDATAPATADLAPAPPAAAITGQGTGPISTQMDAGMCLDVAGWRRDDGAPVILWNCHGGNNQQFTWTDAGELRVYDGTKCLDAWGGQGNDGDELTIYDCHGRANQKWQLTEAGEIRGINGKCVDAWANGTAGGTRLVIYTCHGGRNQRWNAPAPGGGIASAPAPRSAPAPTGGALFVATNGSDANPGTESAPWRTVGQAIVRLQPGQTLYVRGGTYVENIKSPTIQAGRPDARIRVAAYPGERPVIEGLLWLKRPSYWTLDGINVTWAAGNLSTDHMVKMTNGVGWVVENSEFWGARSYAGLLVGHNDVGVASGEPRDWTVRRNCIHDTHPSNGTNKDHNIYANPGTHSHGGVIEENILFNALNGEGIKIGGPTATTGGSGGIAVRRNTIFNSAQNVLLSWQTSNTIIERNLFVKVSGTYANVRGYQLSGGGNVAFNNLGAAARSLLLNDAGYTPVADGGGNVFAVDPQFDAISCTGFHPQNPAAQGYGRYAR